MRFMKLSAAVALGLVALAGPAFAAGGYTVTANGATSGDYAFSAHSDFVTVAGVTCTDVTLNGEIHAGTNVNPWATITSSTWNSCSSSGQPATVTPNHNPPWTLSGTGPATTGTNDQVASSLGGVNLGIGLLGGACTFRVTGSANGTFGENNGVGQNIDIEETMGNLKTSGVSLGCFGVVSNGMPVPLTSGHPFVISGPASPIYLS